MMKMLKKVVIINILVFFIQVCTTQNSQAPSKATFKSFDVSYASAGVDVSKEENVSFKNGTNIKVPVNAFVDASGTTVKGKVDIEYRELKNASEIVASGIPTNYANDKKQQFETEGVIEVRAKSNGKQVYLAKNKTIEVKLPKEVAAGQNLYYLEEGGGKSSSLLHSPFISQAHAQSDNDKRRWVLVHQGITSSGGTPPANQADTTPITNIRKKKGFKLKLNLAASPELAKYRNTRWAFAGKNEAQNPTTEANQWVLNETWDRMELVQALFAPNVVLKGHQKAVATAVFSPNGSYLVTASSDKTAKVWSVTGRLIATLRGHKDFIRTAVFSKNNQYIVTASGDNTAKIWSTRGQLLHTLSGHTNSVYSASFSPDGKKVITGSEDGTAKIWSFDGKLLKTLTGHRKAVYSTEFSPNGKYVLTASADKTAKVWSLDGKIIRDLKRHRRAIFSARFSPNGSKIVTASADRTARIWSFAGKQLHRLKGHRKAVYAATFSPNGQYILTASEDNTAKLWDVQGTKVSTLKSENSPFSYAVFSPNGRYILTASKDNTAKLWTKPDLAANTPYQLELSNNQKVFQTTIKILPATTQETASVERGDTSNTDVVTTPIQKSTEEVVVTGKTIKVNRCGYYSFARPIRDKNTITMRAQFKVDGKKLNNATIYLISGKNDKVVTKFGKYEWRNFRFNPGERNQILAILPDDRVATLGRKDFRKIPVQQIIKNKKYVFDLSKKSKVKSLKVLKQLLQ
ncbi:WD40 repeat domain-containing protein [uncultured Microscilla sp.]|uniref:WD40 repeat domain-containing protein n=1 Tax=uncultured Microscilla sp. TaxID=432653 RepID=UPI002602923B|nr:WD40 repeat domain-containing protein [uncultured Microscilla sp.]